jgi:cold shock CspA family protein
VWSEVQEVRLLYINCSPPNGIVVLSLLDASRPLLQGRSSYFSLKDYSWIPVRSRGSTDSNGFGFIPPDEVGDDLHVQPPQAGAAGFKTLAGNRKARFGAKQDRQGLLAPNIKLP